MTVPAALCIDGMDIKEYDVRVLRDNIAVAMQDIFLFSETIEGNIAYGASDVPVEKVLWAAETARAHEFITEFPEGYDTIIGERGVGLSGAKQRIAGACAGKGSADNSTRRHHIKRRYRNGARNTAEPEGVLQKQDHVHHCPQDLGACGPDPGARRGRIVERGTHSELLSLKGHYYSTFVNQYGDFDMMRGD